MANYQLYIRKNSGAWFPNGSDPVTNTGGIDLSAMAGTPMFPTVQGSGDGNLTCNFGASTFSGTGPPSGYMPGWPHVGGGFTTLDPTKLFGSGALSGGNLVGTFNTAAGMAQAVDGYTAGKYFFQLTLAGRDLFSNSFGGGVGANYTLNGGDFNFWFSTGAFKTGDTLGGAGIQGGSLSNGFQASIFAVGAAVATDVFTFDDGDVLDFAVFLTGSAPATGFVTVADLWFGNTSGFVDLTAVSNRRRFIAVNGGAQDLGVDGSNPFGVAPPVFLTRRGVDTPAHFATNNGRGGAFAIVGGTLANGATNPPGTSTSTTTLGAGSPGGQGVLGSYLDGNLYAFNPATYTDNGTPRKWVRRWRGLPTTTMKAVRYSHLVIDMETGAGVPVSADPQLVLRWSDDGGHSWSSERYRPAGKLGQTKITIKFNRLGSTRRFAGSDRIFELSSTDPFKLAIIDAEVETSPPT